MARKVVLYDIDGKIPNLALMKLSTHYKSKGVTVYLSKDIKYISSDKYFASTVFYNSKSQKKISMLKKIYGADIRIGGSGICLKKRLPDEIEKCFPDYSLYDHSKYALGFLTRGCDKKCSFCLVPKKEGIIKTKRTSFEDFVPDGQKNVKLLDDNLLAFQDVENVLKEIIKNKYSINFSQSLDITYFNDRIFKLFLSINSVNSRFSRPMIYFSCNNNKTIREFIDRKSLITSYKKHFGKDSVTVITMFGFNTRLSEDYSRFILLKKLGLIPFFQLYFPIPGVKSRISTDYFNMDLNEIIKLTFKSNGQNWEKYLRWINKLYFKTFGRYYYPLLKTIYKYNNKKAINKFLIRDDLLTTDLYKYYNLLSAS